MLKLQNKPVDHGPQVDKLRSSYEHRATWMSLILREARAKGLEWDDIGRKAIFECGCMHGKNFASQVSNPSSMEEFSKIFAVGVDRDIFDMECVASDADRYYLDFHYCPLVSAWEKLGFSSEDIAHLCDVAMDGDRGIASQFPDFEFSLGKTIAGGHHCCEIRFDKKK